MGSYEAYWGDTIQLRTLFGQIVFMRNGLNKTNRIHTEDSSGGSQINQIENMTVKEIVTVSYGMLRKALCTCA